MPTGVQDNPFEWKLGYLLPVFFVVGALVNLAVSSALGLTLTGFNALSIHAKNIADYGIDAFDLAFAPVDPDIVSEINREVSAGSGSVDEPVAAPPLIPMQPAAVPNVVETVALIADDMLEEIRNNLDNALPKNPFPSLFP